MPCKNPTRIYTEYTYRENIGEEKVLPLSRKRYFRPPVGAVDDFVMAEHFLAETATKRPILGAINGVRETSLFWSPKETVKRKLVVF